MQPGVLGPPVEQVVPYALVAEQQGLVHCRHRRIRGGANRGKRSRPPTGIPQSGQVNNQVGESGADSAVLVGHAAIMSGGRVSRGQGGVERLAGDAVAGSGAGNQQRVLLLRDQLRVHQPFLNTQITSHGSTQGQTGRGSDRRYRTCLEHERVELAQVSVRRYLDDDGAGSQEGSIGLPGASEKAASRNNHNQRCHGR